MTFPEIEAGDGPTKVLLAIVSGKRTIRAISEATGMSVSTVHKHVKYLRRMGFVAFEDGQKGTLHPLVRQVR